MKNNPRKTNAILVVDQDLRHFTALGKQQTSLKKLPIIMAANAVEADALIANPQWRFTGIFVNPLSAEPGGISVFRSAFKYRPATPIYLLVEKGKPQLLGEEDLSRLGIKHALDRETIAYDDLLKLSSQPKGSQQIEDAHSQSQGETSQPIANMIEVDQTYIAIRAEDFFSTGKTIFDVYVKISTGKYVCLVKAGDSFSISQLETYLAKGVTRFYLRREIYTHYLALCDHLTSTLLKKGEVSIEAKANQTLLQGEETLAFLRDRGLSQENMKYASRFIANVCSLVDQVKISREDVFRDFMANVASYDHAVGTTILGSILASTLEVKLEDPIETVGISCLLHDIGLTQVPPELWHEDESRMTSVELALFRSHPSLGAGMLREMKVIHPAVIQAVEFHHMRIDPDNYGVKRVFTARHRLAEIVEISSEFNRLIHLSKTDSKFALLEYLEKNVFPCFTKQVVYAFRSSFFPNKKIKKAV